MESYIDIINRWPSSAALARGLDINPETVRKWKERDNIPSDAWLPITKLAIKDGLEGVTLDLLAKIAADKYEYCADEDK